MFGAVVKNYLAEKLGVPREKLVLVSVMPCLAKKTEAARPEFSVDGNPDVDIVLSTRELARLIKLKDIDLAELPDSEFDSPLGESTGAAVIFGSTGGVIEAAVRTAYELHTGKPLPKIDFEELRGFEGIRIAEIDVDGVMLKIAVAHGLGNAKILMDEVRAGNPRGIHAIEVMACKGGCIGGAGQPYHHGDENVLLKRIEAIYEIDRNMPIRKSHENASVLALYRDYYGEPGSELAHHQLHTHYVAQDKF